MRLKSCYIFNFGVLHEFRYDFQSPVDYIIKENGFGKSTLAAFIRIMLFGFEGENRRDITLKERKYYEPWQGGNYGGELVFEVEGKTYSLTRMFKDKRDKDVFELRDADTNLISDAYSVSIGEELFGMDCETFKRTVFIGQDECFIQANDSVAGRIGSLVDSTDDINSFEKALEKLEKEAGRLGRGRKKGEITLLSDRISLLSSQLENEEALKNSLEAHKELVDKAGEKKEELLKRKEKLMEASDILGRYRDSVEHGRAVSEMNSVKEELEALTSEFSGEVPDRQKVKSLCDEIVKADAKKDEAKLVSLTNSDLKIYNELVARYGDKPDRDEATDMFNRTVFKGTISTEEAMLKDKLDRLKSEISAAEKKKKKKSVLVAFVGILLGCFAFPVFMILGSPIVGVAIAIAITLMGIIFSLFLRKENGDDDDQDEMLSLLTQKYDNCVRDIDEIDTEVGEYLKRFGIAYNPVFASQSIQQVIGEIDKVVRYSDRVKYINDLNSSADSVYEEVDAFIGSIGFSSADDRKSILESLSTKMDRIDNVRKRYDELKEALTGSQSSEVPEFEVMELPTDVPGDMKTISAELNQTINELQECSNTIAENNRRIIELEDRIEDMKSIKQQLEALRREYDDMQRRYDCVCAASDHLVKAKETLTSSYTEPILERFKYYYGLITNDTQSNYMIDAQVKLTIKDEGMQHSVFSLSRGLRDVVGMSLRIALIDVMFPKEKPVIIMDDPFVNLDKFNLSGASRLMKEITDSYQVVFFTARNDNSTLQIDI